MTTFVTPSPWLKPKKGRYGIVESYRVAADWLRPCRTVADWGCGGGYFERYLSPNQRYIPIDGTRQIHGQILADLATYEGESDGIMLRHVVDCTNDWRAVLLNVVRRFRRRAVVITFTPMVERTLVAWREGGWTFMHFDHNELLDLMEPFVVDRIDVEPGDGERRYETERVYRLEKR